MKVFADSLIQNCKNAAIKNVVVSSVIGFYAAVKNLKAGTQRCLFVDAELVRCLCLKNLGLSGVGLPWFVESEFVRSIFQACIQTKAMSS